MSLNYKLELNKLTSEISSIGIGGIVPMYFDIYNTSGLIEVTEILDNFKTPYYVIGNCSKILFPDHFPKMALIHLRMNIIEDKDEYVEVEAGVKLIKLVMYMANHGFDGFAGLISIPGEVGGSLINNAGAYGDELGKVFAYADVLEDGIIKRITSEEVLFGYRYCSLKTRKLIVIKVGFKKIIGNKEEIIMKQKQYHKQRIATQPIGVLTLGSTFKNPPNISIAKEVDLLSLKGLRDNQMMVSEKHANFLINIGSSTQKNMLNIIDILIYKLYNKLGIIPELEIIILRW